MATLAEAQTLLQLAKNKCAAGGIGSAAFCDSIPSLEQQVKDLTPIPSGGGSSPSSAKKPMSTTTKVILWIVGLGLLTGLVIFIVKKVKGKGGSGSGTVGGTK